MNQFVAFGFVIIFLLCPCSSDIIEEDGVLVLTDSNFEDVISKHDFILVEFYAPWCGHCQELAPEYSQAAKELKESSEQHGFYIPLAKIDATVEVETTQKYEIEGFPTLKFFSKSRGIDRPVDYEGERSSSAIVEWVLKRLSPPAKQLISLEDVSQFIEKSKTDVGVIYFAISQDDPELDIFLDVAFEQTEITFAYTLNIESRLHYSIGEQKVVLFRPQAPERLDFTEDIEPEALIHWLSDNAMPAAIPLNTFAIQLLFNLGKPGLLFFYDRENNKDRLLEFIDIADRLKDLGVKFVYLDKENEGWQELIDFIGINIHQLPQLSMFDAQKDFAKYIFTETFNESNISNFLKAFNDGQLIQHRKSQEIPENNDLPLKVVVGKSFKEQVIDSTKDVFVEFYAPWCTHCQQLAPTYEKLAEVMQHNPNILIAKIDGTENEIESLKIEQYPSIYFYKNGDKDTPIEYLQDFTLEDFLEFLQTNTSYNWVDVQTTTVEDL